MEWANIGRRSAALDRSADDVASLSAAATGIPDSDDRRIASPNNPPTYTVGGMVSGLAAGATL